MPFSLDSDSGFEVGICMQIATGYGLGVGICTQVSAAAANTPVEVFVFVCPPAKVNFREIRLPRKVNFRESEVPRKINLRESQLTRTTFVNFVETTFGAGWVAEEGRKVKGQN